MDLRGGQAVLEGVAANGMEAHVVAAYTNDAGVQRIVGLLTVEDPNLNPDPNQ